MQINPLERTQEKIAYLNRADEPSLTPSLVPQLPMLLVTFCE
jgi:hypothetical protein